MKIFLQIIWKIIQSFYHVGIKRSEKYSKIIMFHYVTDDITEKNPQCKCTVNEFLLIIDDLKKDGYEFVSIDEALGRINKKSFYQYCVISFDDATEDVYKTVYPILKKREIPFIVYVPIGLVDTAGFISKEQLQEMAQDPLCTIGSHTIHHVKLRDNMDAKNEIYSSKKLIEKMIGKDVKHFAYPWGTLFECSIKNMLWVKKIGYESAVSTLAAPLHRFSTFNKYYLPRINMAFFRDKLK